MKAWSQMAAISIALMTVVLLSAFGSSNAEHFVPYPFVSYNSSFYQIDLHLKNYEDLRNPEYMNVTFVPLGGMEMVEDEKNPRSTIIQHIGGGSKGPVDNWTQYPISSPWTPTTVYFLSNSDFPETTLSFFIELDWIGDKIEFEVRFENLRTGEKISYRHQDISASSLGHYSQPPIMNFVYPTAQSDPSLSFIIDSMDCDLENVKLQIFTNLTSVKHRDSFITPYSYIDPDENHRCYYRKHYNDSATWINVRNETKNAPFYTFSLGFWNFDRYHDKVSRGEALYIDCPGIQVDNYVLTRSNQTSQWSLSRDGYLSTPYANAWTFNHQESEDDKELVYLPWEPIIQPFNAASNKFFVSTYLPSSFSSNEMTVNFSFGGIMLKQNINIAYILLAMTSDGPKPFIGHTKADYDWENDRYNATFTAAWPVNSTTIVYERLFSFDIPGKLQSTEDPIRIALEIDTPMNRYTLYESEHYAQPQMAYWTGIDLKSSPSHGAGLMDFELYFSRSRLAINFPIVLATNYTGVPIITGGGTYDTYHSCDLYSRERNQTIAAVYSTFASTLTLKFNSTTFLEYGATGIITCPENQLKMNLVPPGVNIAMTIQGAETRQDIMDFADIYYYNNSNFEALQSEDSGNDGVEVVSRSDDDDHRDEIFLQKALSMLKTRVEKSTKMSSLGINSVTKRNAPTRNQRFKDFGF